MTPLTRGWRSRRPSAERQYLTLAPALRGLGNALGAAGPRLDFQRELRQRLIDEARLLAAQPRTRPRFGRPRRPKGGGIRLAAIGIGFSLAGSGVVAVAHSLTLPARAAATTPGGAPGSTSRPPPQVRGLAPLTGGPLASGPGVQVASVLTVAAPVSAAPASPASPSPREGASTLMVGTETPSAAAPATGLVAAGRVDPTSPSDQTSPPVSEPSQPDPLTGVSASPLPLDSPLR